MYVCSSVTVLLSCGLTVLPSYCPPKCGLVFVHSVSRTAGPYHPLHHEEKGPQGPHTPAVRTLRKHKRMQYGDFISR